MLNKAIYYGKEHRKPYRGMKAFDRSCRNHGDCYYALKNRIYNSRKALIAATDKIRDCQDIGYY